MKEEILDDIRNKEVGIISEKHHSQARGILCFYSFSILIATVLMAEYARLTNLDILDLVGRIIILGYIFYFNYQQLKAEKTESISFSHFSKIPTTIFIIFSSIFLIYSVYVFVVEINEDWYRFSVLVLFTVIISTITIILKELKYLRLNT